MASSARIDELKQKFDENPRRYFAPLANEFRKVGDLEQAILICEAYLPQQPGHMSGHIVYGQALFESNRLDEAQGVFQTALSLDPENLIALRHLGDIAAGSGDPEAARQWYQRVLEADPRNEEIAALIEALPAAEATQPPADPHVESSSSESHEVVVGQSFTQISSTDSLDRSADDSGMDAATPDALDIEHASGFDPAGALSPDVQQPESPEPPGFEQTLDLEISLPELNGAGSAATSEAPPASEPEPPAASDATSASDSGLLDFADFAIPGSPAPSAPEADLSFSDPYGGVLGAAPDEPSLPESFGDGAEPSGPPLGEAEYTGELGTLDESTLDAFAGDATVADAWVVEASAIDAEQATDSARATDAAASDEPDSSAPVAATVPEAFVTETMAELYLRQGHVTEALDLYDRLMAQRPYDDALAARAAAARQQVLGGPTIREFLMAIFHPRVATSATNSEPRETANTVADVLWAGAAAPSADDERIAAALARGFGGDASRGRP